MACILKTFEFEAKYNDSSKQYKAVIIKGPPNVKGETPVNFKGYQDTVWIPQTRLRKTEASRTVEFPCLEQAFQVAADGDTIEVQDCGVHLMRDSVDIKTAITVRGLGPLDTAKKPTISAGGGMVFRTHAQVSLHNLYVKSVGGNKFKGFDVGGCGAVWMKAGNLSIVACSLTSENGSAVCLEGNLEHLNIETSVIGPCGRHGLVLDRCAGDIVVKDVEIFGIGMTGSGLVVRGGHIDVSKCTIKNCEMGSAVWVVTGSLTLQDCKIEKCKLGIHSEGAKSKVVVDKTTSIINCDQEQKAEGGGQIDTEDTTASAPDPTKVIVSNMSMRKEQKIVVVGGTWCCS